MEQSTGKQRTTRTADGLADAVRTGVTPKLDHEEIGVAGLPMYVSAHSKLTSKLRESLQSYLLGIEGREFESFEEMDAFARNVARLLDIFACSIAVPEGSMHAGKPARLLVSNERSGPRFQLRFSGGSTTLQRNGMQVPRMDLVERPRNALRR